MVLFYNIGGESLNLLFVLFIFTMHIKLDIFGSWMAFWIINELIDKLTMAPMSPGANVIKQYRGKLPW